MLYQEKRYKWRLKKTSTLTGKKFQSLIWKNYWKDMTRSANLILGLESRTILGQCSSRQIACFFVCNPKSRQSHVIRAKAQGSKTLDVLWAGLGGKKEGRLGWSFFRGGVPQRLSAQEPPRRAFVVLMDPKGLSKLQKRYSLAKSNRNPGVWQYFVQYSDLSFGDFRRGIGVAPRHLSVIRAKASPWLWACIWPIFGLKMGYISIPFISFLWTTI